MLLPHLPTRNVVRLPYGPHTLPGARDIEVLYGTMKVSEWVPKDGRKALSIHGDTTLAPILGPIASQLVDKGCRVMLFGKFISSYLELCTSRIK